MSRTFTRLAPKRNSGFSRGQYPTGLSLTVACRLFRRDHSGAVHFEGLNFHRKDSRRDMSFALRAARHRPPPPARPCGPNGPSGVGLLSVNTFLPRARSRPERDLADVFCCSCCPEIGFDDVNRSTAQTVAKQGHGALPIVIIDDRSGPGYETLEGTHRVDCKSNFRRQTQINQRPLSQIHFAAGKWLERVSKGLELRCALTTVDYRPMQVPVLVRLGFKFEPAPNFFQIRHRVHQVAFQSNRKKSVNALSNNKSLNHGAKESNKNCGAGPDCGPSIPVNHARFAEPPALAHTFKHRHRNPSLLEPILP